MVVDELVTILGINIAANAIPNVIKFNAKLETVIGYCEKVAAAALVTGGAVVAFVEKMSSSASGIAIFNHYTGMSTDAIQKWSYAAEQAGGNVGELKSDIINLTKSLNPLMLGRYNEGLWMAFGADAANIKTFEQAMTRINAFMQGKAKPRQLQWAEMFGLSPSGTLLVQQSTDKFNESLREMQKSFITPEQAEQGFRFTQIWNKLKTEMYKTGENIITLLLPGIQKMLTGFDQFLNITQKWINSGIQRFVEGVGIAFNNLGDAITKLPQDNGLLKKIFEIFLDPRVLGGAAETALIGIGVALGVIAAKYAIIGAAVLAVIKLFELAKDLGEENAKGNPSVKEKLDSISQRVTKDVASVKAKKNAQVGPESTTSDILFTMLPDWAIDAWGKMEKHGLEFGQGFVDTNSKFLNAFKPALPVTQYGPRVHNTTQDNSKGDTTINHNYNTRVEVPPGGDGYEQGLEIGRGLERFRIRDQTGATVNGEGW